MWAENATEVFSSGWFSTPSYSPPPPSPQRSKIARTKGSVALSVWGGDKQGWQLNRILLSLFWLIPEGTFSFGLCSNRSWPFFHQVYNRTNLHKLCTCVCVQCLGGAKLGASAVFVPGCFSRERIKDFLYFGLFPLLQYFGGCRLSRISFRHFLTTSAPTAQLLSCTTYSYSSTCSSHHDDDGNGDSEGYESWWLDSCNNCCTWNDQATLLLYMKLHVHIKENLPQKSTSWE